MRGFHAAHVSAGVAAAGVVMALAFVPAHPKARVEDATETPVPGQTAAAAAPS